MKNAVPLCFAGLFALSACGSGNHATDLVGIDGPNVKTLSHEQLMDIIQDCRRSERPHTQYSAEYCSAAQSAFFMEGYATSSSTPVDPTLTRMH